MLNNLPMDRKRRPSPLPHEPKRRRHEHTEPLDWWITAESPLPELPPHCDSLRRPMQVFVPPPLDDVEVISEDEEVVVPSYYGCTAFNIIPDYELKRLYWAERRHYPGGIAK